MKYIVRNNNQDYDLYSFIYENIAKTNYAEFRDVDHSIGLITKLIESQSRLLKTLFEENIISELELKEILAFNDFKIIVE